MEAKNCTLFLRNKDLVWHNGKYKEFLTKISSQSLVRKEEGNVSMCAINGQSQTICGIVIGVRTKTNGICLL